MNDTTRELGSMLGVAAVGSVASSICGPRLIDELEGLPIPELALTAAVFLPTRATEDHAATRPS